MQGIGSTRGVPAQEHVDAGTGRPPIATLNHDLGRGWNTNLSWVYGAGQAYTISGWAYRRGHGLRFGPPFDEPRPVLGPTGTAAVFRRRALADQPIWYRDGLNRYYEDTGDARWAVRETLATTGAALLFTSLILVFGFAVFLAAYLANMRWFGLLTSFATVVAFLADVLLAPALLMVTRGLPRRLWGRESSRRAPVRCAF